MLVDENDVLKLADFGVSTIMENGNDQLATNAGTKAFLAPETWDGKPFKGKKADVWAAAATLYFLVVGKLPFHATNAEDLKKKIQEDQLKPISFNNYKIFLFWNFIDRISQAICLPVFRS